MNSTNTKLNSVQELPRFNHSHQINEWLKMQEAELIYHAPAAERYAYSYIDQNHS